MVDASYALLALAPVVAWFIYTQAYNWRFNKYKRIPEYFPKSLFFGHLTTIAGSFKKLGDSRRHADYALELLWKDAGCPPVMLLDLRPATYAMALVASHDVAEQITKISKPFPWSVPKSPTLKNFKLLIGPKSILTEEGEPWKALRKRFNIGFAPNHLITLLPAILSKSAIFMEKLDALTESGVDFDMDPLTTDLTFDIIGEIVTNIDLQAQGDPAKTHEIVSHFRELLKTFSDTGRIWLAFNLPVQVKRRYYSYYADRAVKRCIREKFTQIKAAQKDKTKESRDRSVLALALEDTDDLTNEHLQAAADQVKTFFFAGHDTTSILLQWLFYAFSIHPKALATIRAEHDAIFGDRDPQQVFTEKPDETIKALSYTSACIKEALRLWPPAGSARLSAPGKGLKIRTDDGQEILMDGTMIYLNHYLIHRDPKVYGPTASEFVPERWLGDTDTTAMRKDDDGSHTGESKIPISAWRPFERGPRNCIGQELANLEARVILAMVLRRYDFTKVGAGEAELDEKGNPILDETGKYKTKSPLFNYSMITAKPFDRCRMRVKMHKA